MTFSNNLSLAANFCPARARSGSAPHIAGSEPHPAGVGQPYRSVPGRRVEVIAPRSPATKSAGGRPWR
jgi:hypothetical protein